MEKIGFLPLRKGSKGILNKNKKKMLGRPLFSWVLSEAIFSELDKIYVYTDDEKVRDFVIKEYFWTDKVEVLIRSEKSSTDTASTEMAILEFCDRINYDFSVFCLIQATTPQTKKEDINNCLRRLENSDYTSALTIVKTHRFTWNKDGTAANYDVFNRPRRQDFEGLLIENGALYCTTKEALQQNSNRIGEQSALVEMSEDSLHEIDHENDWLIVEKLLASGLQQKKTTHKITHLVLDVDGVFTDAKIHYSKDGELSKQFDMRDGMGLEILRENDVEIMAMTSENSELVAQRMKKLKIDEVYLGVKDKYARLQHIAYEKGLSFNQMAYMGDDVNDLSNMCRVGWSITPQNAVPIIKEYADIILSENSGEGAIRSACQFITKYNNRFKN